jgi:hypothetical protein
MARQTQSPDLFENYGSAIQYRAEMQRDLAYTGKALTGYIYEENRRAKADINRKALNGKSRDVLVKVEYDQQMAAGAMPICFSRLIRYGTNVCRALNMNSMPTQAEWIQAIYTNKTSFNGGQKFSRWLLSNWERAYGYPNTDPVVDTHTTVNEIPTVKQDQYGNCTPQQFVQAFYSHLAGLKGSLVISTRVRDIGRMSWHTPWASCTKPGGIHSSSPYVYVHDNVTAVLYNYVGKKRVGRSLIYFDPGVDHLRFTIQRVYGTMSDDLIRLARRELQKRLAKANKVSNRWFYRNPESGTFVENTGYENAYIDYPKSVARHRDLTSDWISHLDFPRPLCIDCGEEHREYGEICCLYCRGQYQHCGSCGERKRMLSMIRTIHGNYTYCRECQAHEPRYAMDVCREQLGLDADRFPMFLGSIEWAAPSEPRPQGPLASYERRTFTGGSILHPDGHWILWDEIAR